MEIRKFVVATPERSLDLMDELVLVFTSNIPTATSPAAEDAAIQSGAAVFDAAKSVVSIADKYRLSDDVLLKI